MMKMTGWRRNDDESIERDEDEDEECDDDNE